MFGVVFSTHQQEHTQLYLQHLVLVKPLLLPELEICSKSSTIAAGSSNGLEGPDAVDTIVCAPDDGWRYHPKYVEQFPGIN